MIDALQHKQLIFVTGKGGVGKSSVAAGLGRAFARRGKRTLVVETDAFSVMEDLLNVAAARDVVRYLDASSSTSEPVRVDEHLWSTNLEATDCFVLALQRFVPSKRIARAVVDNKVARVFFKAAPSVNEFVLLDRIFLLAENQPAQAFDHIIVDLPASGHAVTFLNVPRTLHDMIKVGPIARRSKEMAVKIEDPEATAIVAVCLPEEMPVRETIELSHKLHDALGRGLSHVLINRVHPSPVSTPHQAALRAALKAAADDSAAHRVLEGNELALGWFERDRHYIDLLQTEIDAPLSRLPMVYATDGHQIVDAITDRLARAEAGDLDPLAS